MTTAFAIIFAAAAVIALAAILLAPEGYEDEDGFHYGRDEE